MLWYNKSTKRDISITLLVNSQVIHYLDLNIKNEGALKTCDSLQYKRESFNNG